ncbi:MAG: Acetyl-coenzyme A carboxyl transferase alpha chain [Candidatus Ozemobacter sibiricus]|uniref:Acetyl-coenzyme A carboxylase carboxyl transferase subunit alpha n=1 Tax=Candidatus Ozemobacter sibiricus TaxID=2268124 RepID=A0A367ZKI8_9BACT|nr:MAG: Acetyl-coenzyme A carboxyl transferase alpha chain [Candidatus Ozemobacter sibiricus]
MTREFDFERPIVELEKRLHDLQTLSEDGQIDLSREIKAIADKIALMKAEIFKSLEPWQYAQVARHIDRPFTLDYVKILCGDSFVELHGDRYFGDDPAMVAGFGRIGPHAVAIIGHQKGHDTDENLFRNFGMPHPEGYRKAMRIMRLAERFKKPVVVFIDTPGAFPGIGAEERGQSEAIARNLADMSRLAVPILCFVIGEGGSGGALAVGIGDRVFMLEYSIYSVISAEGCAAILWKDASRAKDAARALRLRASDLLEFGIIDQILPEPLGGAHRDPAATAATIKAVILEHLAALLPLSPEELLARRYAKFRAMGRYKVQDDAETPAKN